MPRFNNIAGVLVQYTEAEETARDSAESAWLSASDARTAVEVRQERDALIAATDWWALGDRSITDAQTAYRLALRNVPAQAGFPNSITWPTKP